MDAVPAQLEALTAPVAEIRQAVDIPPLRVKMLYDAACSAGARGGLSARGKAIQEELDRKASVLDRLYPFQAVMLSNGLLPPVISEALDNVKQEVPNAIRYAGAVYRIEAPERFVTVAPTWRDFLLRGLGGEESIKLPQADFMPKSSAERTLWKNVVTECWDKGVAQADAIFDLNYSRLERDFKGMVRYRLLAVRGMVNEPRVGIDRKASGGNGNELIVDDQLFQVTAPVDFRRDAAKWR